MKCFSGKNQVNLFLRSWSGVNISLLFHLQESGIAIDDYDNYTLDFQGRIGQQGYAIPPAFWTKKRARWSCQKAGTKPSLVQYTTQNQSLVGWPDIGPATPIWKAVPTRTTGTADQNNHYGWVAIPYSLYSPTRPITRGRLALQVGW